MSVAKSFEAIDRAQAEFSERQRAVTPRRRSNGNSSRDSPSDIRRCNREKPNGTIPRPSLCGAGIATSKKYLAGRNAFHFEKSAAQELADIYLYGTIRAPRSSSAGASTCPALWSGCDKRFERPRTRRNTCCGPTAVVFLGALLTGRRWSYYDNMHGAGARAAATSRGVLQHHRRLLRGKKNRGATTSGARPNGFVMTTTPRRQKGGSWAPSTLAAVALYERRAYSRIASKAMRKGKTSANNSA